MKLNLSEDIEDTVDVVDPRSKTFIIILALFCFRLFLRKVRKWMRKLFWQHMYRIYQRQAGFIILHCGIKCASWQWKSKISAIFSFGWTNQSLPKWLFSNKIIELETFLLSYANSDRSEVGSTLKIESDFKSCQTFWQFTGLDRPMQCCNAKLSCTFWAKNELYARNFQVFCLLWHHKNMSTHFIDFVISEIPYQVRSTLTSNCK